VLSGVKDTAHKDVLPPEWQEETRIILIDLASAFWCIVRGGQAGSGIRDGRAVRREGVELQATGFLHFRAVPMRGAGGAKGKDERDCGPEVVDHGAGNFIVAMHGQE
jgi:hypothetical protein